MMMMAKTIRTAALLCALHLAVPAAAQSVPRDGGRLFLLHEENLPADFPQLATCRTRQAGAEAVFLPLLLFAANMVLQEGLEALSRSEARRLASYSSSYGAQGNMRALPPTPLPDPGNRLPQTSCLGVERWKAGVLTSRFVFELRAITEADFSVRPVYAHLVSSDVTAPSRVNTVNTTVLLGFTGIVAEPCPSGTTPCGVRRAELLGSPSFTFRALPAAPDGAVQCIAATDAGCAVLGAGSSLLPRPLGSPAPISVAATVSEASTRLQDAKIQNAIWERQRANLLKALNEVIAGALE